MSTLNILENVETELDRIRRVASRIDDGLILYLMDMTILAVKRKALSECVASEGQGRLRDELAARRQNKANFTLSHEVRDRLDGEAAG
ncbi:MAG TPA: hypothetical protein VFE63_06330 [Roseiarcus sp.]|jgi:hypothetical protein|nr:hypothetical protein [Roseiarcus sp.]